MALTVPPAVVMVHGQVVSSRSIVPSCERMARYCRVYAPELPEFGRSNKPSRALDVSILAEALVAQVQAAGLGER